MEPNRQSNLKWLFTSCAVVSLLLCVAASILWARTCVGTFDDIEWSGSSGCGVAIWCANGDVVIDAIADGMRKRRFDWDVRTIPDAQADFHTACDVHWPVTPRGNHSVSVTLPWWWLVLTTAVLPGLRIRAEIKSRKRSTHQTDHLAWLVAVLVLASVTIANISAEPKTVSGSWFRSRSPDSIEQGWPFRFFKSASIDDATTYRQWAFGALVADIYAAVLFALIAAAATLAIVGLIRWMISKRRVKAGCCSICLYDLTGNTSGICPECGAPTPAKDG